MNQDELAALTTERDQAIYGEQDMENQRDMAVRRAEIAEARLRNVIGWRENDWPEWFDRRTAEAVAELASPSAETVGQRIAAACREDHGS